MLRHLSACAGTKKKPAEPPQPPKPARNPAAVSWLYGDALRLLDDERKAADSTDTKASALGGFTAAILALVVQGVDKFGGTAPKVTLSTAVILLVAGLVYVGSAVRSGQNVADELADVEIEDYATEDFRRADLVSLETDATDGVIAIVLNLRGENAVKSKRLRRGGLVIFVGVTVLAAAILIEVL